MSDETNVTTEPEVAPETVTEEDTPIDPSTKVGYVTLQQANEYVTSHFISTDALRVAWVALADSDKVVLLQRSFDSIEMLPYRGCKTEYDQTTAFPRYPDSEVPASVQAAQVENAIVLTDTDAAEDASHYRKLWQWGVQSYQIGNLSEKISSGAWGSATGVAAASGIVSDKAIQLLLPYMRGGYDIQGERHRPRKKGCGKPWVE